MKKIFAIILAAMMLLAFTACGKDSSDNNTTTTAPAATVAEDVTTTAEETVTTTPSAETTTEAETPSTPAGAVIEAVATEVFRGAVSDNIYMSAFSGLSFTADEKWTFMTDEELASMANTGITEDDLKNDKLPATIKSNGAVYDMAATLVSEEGVLDATVFVLLVDKNNTDIEGKSLEESVEFFANNGFGIDLSTVTTGSVSYGGEAYYKLDAATENANNSIFACEIGDVYVMVVAASSVESGLDLSTMFK